MFGEHLSNKTKTYYAENIIKLLTFYLQVKQPITSCADRDDDELVGAKKMDVLLFSFLFFSCYIQTARKKKKRIIHGISRIYRKKQIKCNCCNAFSLFGAKLPTFFKKQQTIV